MVRRRLDRGCPASERGGDSGLLLSEWPLECTRCHALTGDVNEIADKVAIASHLDAADCYTTENVSQHRNAMLRRQEE